MRKYRHCIVLTVFVALAAHQALAQPAPLVVERRGNQIHVSAPQLHFLAGKPLERLTNGASVTYVLELSLSAGGVAATRLQERFILSYDLWEEKFSVVQVGASGRSASHLSAAAAEAWCLDNMPLPLPAVNQEKPFSIRFECSYLEGPDAGVEGNPSLTLAGLIDVFSRKKKEEPAHWEAVSKTIRLMDLKQDPTGTRRSSRRARK